MKYGCIGEHLKHSFSKEIHNALSDYEYEIVEIERDRLDEFMTRRDFSAINVTIPYKEAVIPHLYYIDEHARLIGAVNTVVNRDGRLYGYNTDFYGMQKLIEHAGITLKDKKVVILGTGGTSKTAYAVANALGARAVLRVSRERREGAIDYEELYEKHSDLEILINTTPKGMYPEIFGLAADIDRFPSLSGVIDAVYNPLRTPLVGKAIERGIPAEGGLYMLVAQAVRASEIFIDKKYGEGELSRVYNDILMQKENIVLIGMPGSGKSTVGAILAEKLGRKLTDTDTMIVEEAGEDIPTLFEKYGEARFRELECAAVSSLAALTGRVIATGGGAILREENSRALKMNGRLYFLDRPLSALMPTEDRPTARDREMIEKRYNERYSIYRRVADEVIDADASAEEVAMKIIK